ncbi:MAG: DEAD/DEAH box helicase family protein [Oscillospiraceae bacterium]|jgi:N12 class adenine-specific DNA methylase|nr:DEAD/DEAH box helicase family protein [Oscillospiraceae bacterium]
MPKPTKDDNPHQLSLFDTLADSILGDGTANTVARGVAQAVKDMLSELRASPAARARLEQREVQRAEQQRRRAAQAELQKQFQEAQKRQREAMEKLRADALAEKQRRIEESERQRLAEEAQRAEQQRLLEAQLRAEQAEHAARVTSMDLPTDWVGAFADDERVFGVYAESPADGLIKSLTELGRVDIEYISQISGVSIQDTLTALRGSIYQNPDTWNECFYKGWETSDEYLSGNLLRKLKTARDANEKYFGYFEANITAIEGVLPTPLTADEIYITLGSPWVPPDIINAFIAHLTGFHPNINLFLTRYEHVTGVWRISHKGQFSNNPRINRVYGTKRMNALHILERTLNMRTITIYDTVKKTENGTLKEVRIPNHEETIAAGDRQRQMIVEFKRWVWSDETRRQRLVDIYVEKFGGVRRRVFNGDFLTLPGLHARLYDYQRAAVARILLTPNTLLAHDVGAGKTFIMIAAGMELRRMGISKKNIYVVPNNIVGQWLEMFKTLYPDSNVLAVAPRDFIPQKRRAVLEKIRDNDYDAVIMAYSSFELIHFSLDYRRRETERLSNELMAEHTRYQRGAPTSERLKARMKKYARDLAKLKEEIEAAEQTPADGAPPIYFEDLGLNTIFLDEAHNYKNVSIDSKADNILGVNKTGSVKCDEMLAKIQFVQRANNGRGAVFATGTPITNSVTDIYTMQRYLQSGELRFLDIELFDNWAMTFGERVTEFEIDVDTTTYRLATRLSRFHNLPELTALFAQVADFHSVPADDLPENEGYMDAPIEQTPVLREYIQALSKRAEDVRSRRVSRKEDNMLKITTDGRKAALDIRLINPNERFTTDSKAFSCAEQIYTLYRETESDRLTQLVFCDSSTPKAEFNMYHELKRILTELGIPEGEIEFVHNHDTEKRRTELFERMRDGEIRVLLGSTFKLGIGVNVQRKLMAVHHLDVPWRPSDMVQREGRMLRQGNENDSVRVFRYITKGSFDAYSWQLLETKQRFISQLLSDTVAERDASDIDDVVLSYAEVKALAVGNPLIKRRVETANELGRLITLRRKLSDTDASMRQELDALPAKIEAHHAFLEKAEQDARHYAENKIEVSEMTNHRELGQMILDAAREHTLRHEARELLTYQGIRIVLPENMPPDRLAVRLENAGRYYVEIGSSDIGCITRVDNRLNALEDLTNERRRIIDNLKQRIPELEEAIASARRTGEEYAERIAELTNELAAIDKKLGVDEHAEKKR